MDSKTQEHLYNLRSEDRALQNQAFYSVLQETKKPVDWAYDVWVLLIETEEDPKYKKKYASVWK